MLSINPPRSIWGKKKKPTLIYETRHLTNGAPHVCMFGYVACAPRARFVPVCVLHRVKASPLITLPMKRSCVRRFCRSTRHFPAQPTVSRGRHGLRSLPAPTWQTEPRTCCREGVMFNSLASIIKADPVCKISLGGRSDCCLSAPLSTSSCIKGRDGGSRANLPSSAEIKL